MFDTFSSHLRVSVTVTLSNLNEFTRSV